MQLSTLLRRLEREDLLLDSKAAGESVDTITIDHLAEDSREVGPDGCFVAMRGTETDGHLFIDKAVQNGATVVVCEEVPEEALQRFPGTVFLRVTDSRRALAALAAAFYGDPARELAMIGVTGTNGKTTTAYLLHRTLTQLGETTGLIGTIETRIGTEAAGGDLTTPSALDLQRLLRRMVEAGCTACAMEVSSHALDQERVAAIPYDVGIFTNLTSDHLDYHGTFVEYRKAKKKLFDGLPADATALYNVDDPASADVIADTEARRIAYGRGEEADLRVAILRDGLDGLRLRLDDAERKFRLVGSFNAYNLAASYGAVRATGHARHEALDALAAAPPVPGRFEQLSFEGGPTVIVDYAHTPDALENVLQTIRSIKASAATLWCVFGCGGDRDTSKRRVMGSIAEQYADRIIVTSDNPRTEEPEAIMNDIRRGMSRPAEAQWIEDREAAIRAASRQARPDDVVLIAGKGHETYQVVGTEKRPFDDRKVARKHFAENA